MELKFKYFTIHFEGAVKRDSQTLVEGTALVTSEMIAFIGSVDLEKGVIKEPNHELYGKSIVDKILVFPTAKGPTSDPYGLYFLMKKNKYPKAIINIIPNGTTVAGAILSGIPLIYGLLRNPIRNIRSNDFVSIDLKNRIVKIRREIK